MRTYRPDRVGSVIQKELSALLLREIDFPEGVLVTISDVRVSSDLSHAEIGVSIFPENAKKSLFDVLKEKQGTLQFLLNRKMNIKPMPRINFVINEGSEKASRIEKIFLDEDNKEE